MGPKPGQLMSWAATRQKQAKCPWNPEEASPEVV